jgi:hypothetical protein
VTFVGVLYERPLVGPQGFSPTLRLLTPRYRNKVSSLCTQVSEAWGCLYVGGYTTRLVVVAGKNTQYRAREYLTWNDQASLQCCSSGACGGSGMLPAVE